MVGSDGSSNIIVIAGTEKVYLDGVQMVRGETNDYVIDYSNAQITFTAKHLITNLSRIFVDFEYSDGNYERTFAGGTAQTSLADNKIDLRVSYYQEGDDANSSLGVTLSDSDRATSQLSRANRLAASKSGVQYVGRDSITGIGEGTIPPRFDDLSPGNHIIFTGSSNPTDTANL